MDYIRKIQIDSCSDRNCSAFVISTLNYTVKYLQLFFQSCPTPRPYTSAQESGYICKFVGRCGVTQSEHILHAEMLFSLEPWQNRGQENVKASPQLREWTVLPFCYVAAVPGRATHLAFRQSTSAGCKYCKLFFLSFKMLCFWLKPFSWTITQ